MFVFSSVSLSAETITSLHSLCPFTVFFLSYSAPSVAAGTGHNVASHHNSPLEHFQKLLTKKVRRLWQVRMCAGAVQSRYMCNLTKGEEGRQTEHIIRMNELGNCDDMILFMMVVMQW